MWIRAIRAGATVPIALAPPPTPPQRNNRRDPGKPGRAGRGADRVRGNDFTQLKSHSVKHERDERLEA
jgi:hypothetical protein